MAGSLRATRRLRRDAAALRVSLGLPVRVRRDGDRQYVVVPRVPLPPNRFAVAASDLLIVTDHDYPRSALDMFYLVPEALRVDGALPANADAIEQHIGRSWRRFSWHSGTRWNPAGNALCDHFAFAEQRLSQEPPDA